MNGTSGISTRFASCAASAAWQAMNPEWRQVNLVCSVDDDGDVHLERKPLPKMRDELITLFDHAELSKYLTEPELAEFDALPGAGKTEAK